MLAIPFKMDTLFLISLDAIYSGTTTQYMTSLLVPVPVYCISSAWTLVCTYLEKWQVVAVQCKPDISSSSFLWRNNSSRQFAPGWIKIAKVHARSTDHSSPIVFCHRGTNNQMAALCEDQLLIGYRMWGAPPK